MNDESHGASCQAFSEIRGYWKPCAGDHGRIAASDTLTTAEEDSTEDQFGIAEPFGRPDHERQTNLGFHLDGGRPRVGRYHLIEPLGQGSQGGSGRPFSSSHASNSWLSSYSCPRQLRPQETGSVPARGRTGGEDGPPRQSCRPTGSDRTAESSSSPCRSSTASL